MGVINKNDQKIGCISSESSESLNIPQYSEDDDATSGATEPPEPLVATRRLNRRRRQTRPVPLSIGCPRRRPGKKRSRRFENVSQLETLVEDEELSEVSIRDFIPVSSGGFTVLFEDNNAFEVWEEFVNFSEDQQYQIICKYKPENTNLQKDHLTLSGEDAFKSITSKLRNKLRKCRVPLGMVESLEDEVVNFFTASPTDTYVSGILTSFQRLILHAVAQYHGLIARSFNSVADNLRLVRISNSSATFQKPCTLLVQFLYEKRSNASRH